MEPRLTVRPELAPVLEALRRLEPLFHAVPAVGAPHPAEALVAPEFWEVGASGRRYSREHVLNVVRARTPEPPDAAWETSGFHVSEIAPDNYLLTYTLTQPGRVTRRATVWRRTAGAWQAVYHQGTVVQDEA